MNRFKGRRNLFALFIMTAVLATSVLPSYAAGSYLSLNQAVLQLRDAMLARQSTVVLNIESSVDFLQENATRDNLLYPAFSENIATSITAGGYLQGNWSRHNYIVRRNGYNKWEITFKNIEYKTNLAQEAIFMKKLEEVMDELDVWPLSDYMKYLTIYQYVTEHVSYDYDTYQVFLDENGSAAGHETAYTAYGALVEGKAVCQGYAALFYAMCRYADLPVMIVTGQAVGDQGYENHAWNMIQLGGRWYQVDATWDEGKAIWQQRYFAKGTGSFYGHIFDERFTTEAFLNQYGLANDNYTVTNADYEKVCRFRDVSESDYFYYPAWELSEQEIIQGTNKYTFSPYVQMNRGMLITLLYRLAGSPQTAAESGFTDVPDSAYYADAVAWAVENDVTSGVSEDRFGPDQTLTREQLATFLYRYNALTRGEALPEEDHLSAFSDEGQVSDYAREALNWAVDRGIVNGMPGDRIDPKGAANRAQAATMLYRYRNL